MYCLNPGSAKRSVVQSFNHSKGAQIFIYKLGIIRSTLGVDASLKSILGELLSCSLG